ncbi:MAG TPA: AAA family ATPase, partial [Nitrolancea sp.]|nr:AAA family ATPase [Nitrolancea sp.]
MADYTATPHLAPVAPLVGRAREQAILREALDAALAGRGSVVLIGGEAGIGKTALAESLLTDAAGQGALVLVGRCYDLAATPPYGPWAEALNRAPRVEALPPPPDLSGAGAVASQATIFAAVRDALAARAAARPLALLLEDLHWADPTSLDLLRVVARGLADTPLLLLATYRADEIDRRHPLYALLPALVREARAARLDLRALDEAALHALVAARYALPPPAATRLVAYLHSRAEGNPFFAGELLRALEEEQQLRRDGVAWALGDLPALAVPPLLRQVIDARLDRLGEAARELLAVAAVIGQKVPLELWATVAGAGEDALVDLTEHAAEAHLLLPTLDGARFAHALIRETLYEGTLPLRRRVLHRRVAEALLADPDPDPEAVAHHLQQAGDARAPAWLEQAGARAQHAFAWLTATERYESALALLEQRADDPARRGWLLFRLAMVGGYADERRSLAWLDAAVPLLAAAQDPALAAAVRFHR